MGKTKARSGGSRLGQLPWGINEVGLVWLKSLSGLGKGLLRKEGGRLGGQAAGEAQERVTEEGTALEIPSARTCSLGHIPAATSLSPSVSLLPLPLPTSICPTAQTCPREESALFSPGTLWGVLIPPAAQSRSLSLTRDGKGWADRLTKEGSAKSPHSLGQRSATGNPHGVPKVLILGLRAGNRAQSTKGLGSLLSLPLGPETTFIKGHPELGPLYLQKASQDRHHLPPLFGIPHLGPQPPPLFLIPKSQPPSLLTLFLLPEGQILKWPAPPTRLLLTSAAL